LFSAPRRTFWILFITLLLTLGVMILVASSAPLEKDLGATVRVIYFHGAWVWAGKVAFGLAALAGLLALLRVKGDWSNWSLALGRAGMTFWLTYLPMSLWVMQLSWGGLYLDEPRWRVPFAFGVAGLLLQAALVLFNTSWLTGLGNLVFGSALWIVLGGLQNVLHPDSPIFTSNSTRIQVFFLILVGLALLAGALITLLWRRASKKPS
jgi:hypothetical protein